MTLVKDIRPFYESSPKYLTALGHILYFTATDSLGYRLYRSDGTAEGTVPLFQEAPFSDAANLASVGGRIFFRAYTAAWGRELWTTDGTPEGTFMVADVNPAGSSDPASITDVRGLAYFAASDGVHGTELWKSDGTAAGTSEVIDLNPGAAASTPSALKAVGHRLFFTAAIGAAPATLWSTDGTVAGTTQAIDPATGAALTSPLHMIDANGSAIFQASDGIRGAELWSSDGTSASVFCIDDIATGPASSAPAFLAMASGRLYFAASNGSDGVELWSVANRYPAANAGAADRTVNEGASILLDGSASSDADGDPLTFEWRDASAALAGLGAQLSIAPPPGGNTYTLIVRDGVGGAASDSVSITVRANVDITIQVAGVDGGHGRVEADAHDACENPPGGSMACPYEYPADGVAHLVAVPAPDSVFDGWTGACAESGTNATCDVSVTEAATIVATFRGPKTLTVQFGGDGSGRVTLASGQSCASEAATCTYALRIGSSQELTATPATDSRFDSWSGACASQGPVCTITIDSDVSTQAVFVLRNHAPVASAGGPYAGVRNQAITFSGSGSSDPDGDSLTYEWNFGDGATGSGTAPAHAYTALGSFTVTLVVRDGIDASPVGAASVRIENVAPSVALTGPAAGSVLTAPAAITLTAAASDPDGSLTRVEFYAGTTKIGEDTAAPFEIVWSAVPAGLYSLSARAFDDSGATGTSAPVPVTVNAPPIVALQTPADGDRFDAPASVTLTASASDIDGAVMQVEFFQGGTSLGIDTEAPYTVTWHGTAPGVYVLTARATDNRGATVASLPITVKVTATLTPTDDAYVRGGSAYASRNYGTATTLTVQRSSSATNQRWSYIKVDLSGIPTLTSAKLRLYGALGATTNGSVQTAVYPSSDTAWAESGITWANRPTADATALAVATLVNSTIARWYEWDVTQYLQQEKAAGRNVVTLVLQNLANSSPYASFYSKEAATERPHVVIVP